MSARIIIMLNHGTRGLLFHYKKCCYFFGKSIQKYPDSVCENDVNNEQNSRVVYAKPLNERLIILLQKKNVVLASILW